MTVEELYAEGEKTLAAYDQAMASQSGNMADAKLIVIANYGDLCAGILRALLKARNVEKSVA